MKANEAYLTFLGDYFPGSPFRLVGNIPGRIVVNLEAPVTQSVDAAQGKVNLKLESLPVVPRLSENIVAACLANNHSMDYGEQGIFDTIQALDALGIPSFGAGRLADSCNNPLLINVDGLNVALLGYVCPSTHPVFCTEVSPGVSENRLELIKGEIAKCRDVADRVVVCLHWGDEEVSRPKATDVFMARTIADSGADLVIGHHSHCIQSWENWNGTFIFYGLGNAVFPDLDVPCMFDSVGRHQRYRKHQFHWNRCSLAVAWNPMTRDCCLIPLCYSKGVLRAGNARKAQSKVTMDGSRANTAYRRALVFSRIRGLFFGWLRRPKFPERKHLVAIANLLRLN